MKQFRAIKPRYCGNLKVSAGHSIYFELCGNPEGVPCVYLHGGPGYGFSRTAQRLFNLKQTNVLFFDQRGCGQSRPPYSTQANQTKYLIEDINRLMDHVGFDSAMFIGGSWGSTLALTFAIQFPKKVTGIVIWGLFLGTKAANNYYLGEVAQHMYPEAYQELVKRVPSQHRKDVLGYYAKKLRSKNTREAHSFARALVHYESSIYSLYPSPKLQKLNPKVALAAGIMETHYLSNQCFLPQDYILRNVKRLRTIPLSVIHGRSDAICSPKDSYQLHQLLPNSTLRLVVGGHSSHDLEMEQAIREEVKTITTKNKPR